MKSFPWYHHRFC